MPATRGSPLLSFARCRRIGALLVSLLLTVAVAPPPARAADELEIRLEGLVLPVDLRQLQAWVHQPRDRPEAAAALEAADVAVWLNLLNPSTQRDLRQLLSTPLLRERSFGRQLLDSWAGRQVLEEVGTLLTTPDGQRTAEMLNATLQRLIRQRREVTAIDVLQELPAQRLSLQLDTVLLTANQWRQQLDLQSHALQSLQHLGLPRQDSIGSQLLAQPSRPAGVSVAARRSPVWLDPDGREQRFSLVVPHRNQPLPLASWTPSRAGAQASSLPLVLLLPGLGGDIDQLSWLARGLARRGWSVLGVQHPGSDGAALRAALLGQRPPPGGESLALRLDDIAAVLEAHRRGRLPLRGQGVVLMGHSLGAVTALLAAGLMPEPGLDHRCRRALQRLPYTNPSRLLQCQLPLAFHGRRISQPGEVRAVVGFNPFGSLFWPKRGLAALEVPMLLAGGSLDLVTPPLEEQLGLFLLGANPRDRLVVVQGGSHFSPVHVQDDNAVLFRLGDELVGVAPAAVQEMLLQLSSEFLSSLPPADPPALPTPQRRQRDGVTAFVLDAAAAQRWKATLQP